nr:tetratricopeptide repeat protein [Prevotella sp.]
MNHYPHFDEDSGRKRIRQRPVMRHVFSFLLLLGFLTAGAQTIHQKGFVRSVGRPDNKQGVRLPGALLRVMGSHNAVQSGKQGTFELLFNGKREGKDAFSFSSISLNGYDLLDKKIKGPYAISTTVPVELVLVPRLLKQEIEAKVRRQIEANYQKKLSRIQAEKNKLGKMYAQKISQLEQEYEKRDMLIGDMVERYSSLDYAHLDAFKEQLSIFIENGELERADSLIQTEDIRKLEAEHTVLNNAAKKINQALANNTDKLLTIYQGKIDLHLVNFDNDSVGFYKEKIVGLDTTNVKNIHDAAQFLLENLALYDKAETYYRLALRQSLAQHGEAHEDVAESYGALANLYCYKSQYGIAKEYFEKSISIQTNLSGEKHKRVAEAYIGIGFICSSMMAFHEGLAYYQKADNILKKVCGEKEPDLVPLYINMAGSCQILGKNQEAYDYYQKALKLQMEIAGENTILTAKLFHNIASYYEGMKNLDKACEYYQKAMEIRLKVVGSWHPEIASSYFAIGSLLDSGGKYDEAIECLSKSLAISLDLNGFYSSEVANTLSKIANIYYGQAKYQVSEEYFLQALKSGIQVYGPDHLIVYGNYLALANAYKHQEKYAQAIEYFQNALNVLIHTKGENDPDADLYRRVIKELGKKINK